MSQVDWAQIAPILTSAVACVAAAASALVAYMVYRRQTSPDVIAYFDRDADRMMLSLVVKNFGDGVAYDVSISLSRSLPAEEFERDSLDEGFVAHGIPMLVPGAYRDTLLCSTGHAVRELGGDTVDATVKFKGPGLFWKRRFEATYSLDIRSFHGVHVVSSEKAAADALKDMAKHLKDMRAESKRASASIRVIADAVTADEEECQEGNA